MLLWDSIVGRIDGLILSKPCSITSRSFSPTSTYNRTVDVHQYNLSYTVQIIATEFPPSLGTNLGKL